MVSDLWIMEEGISNGHLLIYDTKDLPFTYLLKFSIFTIKKYMQYLQVNSQRSL